MDRDMDAAVTEWHFQLRTLEQTIAFIDQSWHLLIGNGQRPIEGVDDENLQVEADVSHNIRFHIEETTHVLREAKEAVETLKMLGLTVRPQTR